MSIKIKDLTYIYNPNSPFETKALDNVNLELNRGEFIGLIGHTGSGKSTLVQHLNGLIKPTRGDISIGGLKISNSTVKLVEVRKKVGLVFQYPEHQLFEETIYKDIAFGPANLGLGEEDIRARVKEAMELVQLPYEEFKEKSPFELSGGQKRRVAIAGVLAMKPEILILDEPAAGLDPRSRDEILEQIKTMHERRGITIILVSHSMEDIARFVDRIVVMQRGKIALIGEAKEIFKQADKLKSMGLDVPQITHLINKLRERGINLREDVFTVEEAKEEILQWIRGR